MEACRPGDLTCGASAVWFWCAPAVVLVMTNPLGDQRAWFWTPALIVMGVGCLLNTARCQRRHCYVSGPGFLIAAVLALLHGLGVLGLSWTWISVVIVASVTIGFCAELVMGTYAHSS